MLNMVVCLKQVPGTTEVEIDSERGTLKREGVDARTNAYDLHALELAVALKNKHGGSITVLSMGPPQAQAVIREAYALGADRGILLSDRKFAGADTLATAFTLAQAIKKLATPHLVLTGMQTSDGDTAQVGPALAEILGIPHVSYVRKCIEANPGCSVMVEAEMSECTETLRVSFPCLLTCTKDVGRLRLPSYRLLVATRDKPIEVWSYEDIKHDDGQEHFGLDGSPTRVEKVFPPSFEQQRQVWEAPAQELAERVLEKLEELKVL
jgi:electron transfer flavoprotein beta subunit